MGKRGPKPRAWTKAERQELWRRWHAGEMEWALSIDWDSEPLGEMSDVVLARRLEVSPRTVRRQRDARGIPTYRRVDWDLEPLGERRDEELAAELGVVRETVAMQRRARWIPPLRLGIDWGREPLGEMTDQALADKLGVTRSAVHRQRKLRGIPAFTKR